jgi:hypothetical protein
MNIQIVTYSEKAIKIYGDTKPLKDALRSLGAKYNPYLKGGPGWIASKTKEVEIRAVIGNPQPIALASVEVVSAPIYAPPTPEPTRPTPEPTPEPTRSTPPPPPTPPKLKPSAITAKELLKVLPVIKSVPNIWFSGGNMHYLSNRGSVVLQGTNLPDCSLDASHIKANGLPVSIDAETATFANGLKVKTWANVNVPTPLDANELILSVPQTDCSGIIPYLSKDEMKLSMTGVYFDGENMVGTDAHRLRVISAPSEGSAILCKEVATLLKYSGAKAYKNGRVELDGVVIDKGVIDEIYPKYQAVIPKMENMTNTIFVQDKKTFIGFAETAAKINPSTKAVKLTLKDGNLNIYASDIDTGAEVSFDMPATGNDCKVAYNGRLLAECLKSIEGSSFSLHFESAGRPALINDEGLLIMPVMINND